MINLSPPLTGLILKFEVVVDQSVCSTVLARFRNVLSPGSRSTLPRPLNNIGSNISAPVFLPGRASAALCRTSLWPLASVVGWPKGGYCGQSGSFPLLNSLTLNFPLSYGISLVRELSLTMLAPTLHLHGVVRQLCYALACSCLHGWSPLLCQMTLHWYRISLRTNVRPCLHTPLIPGVCSYLLLLLMQDVRPWFDPQVIHSASPHVAISIRSNYAFLLRMPTRSVHP